MKNTIEFAVLKKKGAENLEPFKRADAIAKELRQFLEQAETQLLIRKHNVPGVPSERIQRLLSKKAAALGFEHEKRGLFANYAVPALRPDYFCRIGDTGILLEVEKGKTTMNNMDLLDFWKCHICDHAEYLFLIVPQTRPRTNGTVLRQFRPVQKRLSVFLSRRITSTSLQFIYSVTDGSTIACNHVIRWSSQRRDFHHTIPLRNSSSG